MGVAPDSALEGRKDRMAKETFSKHHLRVAGQPKKTASYCEQNKQFPKADMMKTQSLV